MHPNEVPLPFHTPSLQRTNALISAPLPQCTPIMCSPRSEPLYHTSPSPPITTSISHHASAPCQGIGWGGSGTPGQRLGGVLIPQGSGWGVLVPQSSGWGVLVPHGSGSGVLVPQGSPRAPQPRVPPHFGAQPTGAAVPCTLHLPADDDKWSWGCAAHCVGVGGCG